ncbi:MAG: hypothetical protein N2Z72_00815 [Bacteroidales bacterium]|nr:hypothetical protein [Bacteroidales bacterium]
MFILFQFVYPQEIRKEFTAQIFGDYYYNIQRDSLSTTMNYAILNDPVHMNGLIFRRINAGYTFFLSSKISTKIVWEADNFTFATNNKLSFFPKDASFSFDSLFRSFELSFGIIQPPVFVLSERWWSHRFLERTITDLYNFCSNRDMGISLRGRFLSDRLLFTLMLGNNNGTKLENDRYKALYYLIGFQPVENFIMSLSGAYYFRKKMDDLYDSIPPIQSLNKDEFLLTFFMGYKKNRYLSIGWELFTFYNQHDYNTGRRFVSFFSYGSSLFTNFSPFKSWTFVGRFDYFEPNSYFKSLYDRRIYMLLASDYHVRNDMIISPNLLMEFYEKNAQGKSIKPGITARVTFSWRY